jgi:hypothetical protein
MILSPDQLRSLAASVGFPDPALAAAVAMGESYGHSDAENLVPPSQAAARGQSPEWSLGIWQINNCAAWQGDECVSVRYDRTQLLDPTFNAQVAYSLYSLRGWGPWGAFTNGSYRQYLPAGYAPPATAPPHAGPSPQPLVRPPGRRPDSTGLAMVGALAVAAAAGYAALREWRTQS